MDPLEPEDYYLDEKGLMVFTEIYHRKRGYCCDSGCKHCPWRGAEKPPVPSKKAVSK